ncbi:DUF262 domain-containing protein [Allobacillus sp. GCM10007491]|uniref:DUF262 domain-containing protein n=1 Tax=Allobacillus saliphilus TaxID=2912308 RepID=A0A941HU50_9BACI|nr:DUF262 domain-containing protein [Allobacillus saliphilus]MBR7554515.1 DUF262 domain-containing protein [Allobacillus saliphilus]
MSISNKKIISVEELLELNFSIPDYQRPYKWTVRSINQLFNDILEAYRKNLSEYRIGTIVIHKHDNDRRDIVDGQQRTISLHLINDVLQDSPKLSIPKNKSNISKNYNEIKRLCSNLSSNDKSRLYDYMKEKCHIIIIEIDNEMEAFQFFDSQNARGKALEAHDLLKAYHLREMPADNEEMKLKLIEKWEAQSTNELANLFKGYLYKIKTWSNQGSAHFFNRDGIEVFKGVTLDQQFNFIQYHKAAYLFIEQFNKENHQELLGIEALIPFQIDQPLLAGRRFFEITLHYTALKKEVEKIAIEMLPKSISPNHGNEQVGTKYIRELFQCLLLYYYDRFGINQRNPNIEQLFFKYCYQLRCINQAVYEKSINKYALGKNESLNYRLNLFTAIRDARSPKDLEMTVLDDIKKDDIASKYKKNSFDDLRQAIGVIEGG